MNSYTTFNLGRVKTIQGEDALLQLGKEVAERKISKVLIVTDKGVADAGHVDKAVQSLKAAGVSAVVYDKIKTDPLDTMVVEALDLLTQEKCDMVIGLGGGSSMDVAKGASIMKTNEGHIMEYTRINPNRKTFKNNRIPLALIPTTSGTGSEMSPFAVITNTEINRKSNVTCEFFLPDFIILDPMLPATMDKQMTVSSAFDAISHIIDGYTVRNAILHRNPVVDCFSLKAAEMLYKNIGKVFAIPNDLEARYNVMMGAHLAGAILAAGTGATHGLANMLSKYYHVPHGESVGMLLPYVMKYNILACPERFADLARAMGVAKENMSDVEASEAAVQAVIQLADAVKLPKLSDYMKDVCEIENFLEESLDNSCNYANAREIDLEAARYIFTKAYDRK